LYRASVLDCSNFEFSCQKKNEIVEIHISLSEFGFIEFRDDWIAFSPSFQLARETSKQLLSTPMAENILPPT
jgi:hypothetical protein